MKIKDIDAVFNESDLILLTSLTKRFNKARDSTLTPVKRINVLANALLVGTAYEERLTRIKISLHKLQSRAKKEFESERVSVIGSKHFIGLSKKDQDFKIEEACFTQIQILNYIKAKIERVDYALDYIRSACFNIKSTMSAFKEFLDGE
jgi:hypothetical protein